MADWRVMPADDVIGGTHVKVYPFDDNSQRMFAYAMEMIKVIIDKNSRNENSAFIVPVGPTEQYPYIADVVNANNISLKNTYFFNMDEYTLADGTFIPKDDPLSFRAEMDLTFYSRVRPDLVMDEDHRWFPEFNREEEMWEKIKSVGGVDICFGGIGINGHVAFNEALYADDPRGWDEFAALPTRLLRLTDETKAVNASYACAGEMPRLPTHAMTIGMREIMSSRKLVLNAYNNYHIRRALYGALSPQYPASCIQKFKDAAIYCSPQLLRPLLPAARYAHADGE